MADTTSSLDVDKLVQQTIAEGNEKTSEANKSKSVTLPAGLRLDPAGSSINPFGILDNRVPAGFFTYVFDNNNNVVGFVQGGKYSPLLTPKVKKTAPTGAAKPSGLTPNAEAVSNFNQAQTLQKTAEDEFNNLKVQTEIIKRGNATPDQIDEFKKTAEQYKSTIDTIRNAYQKSGAVQGDINLEGNGKLKTGTQYVDPSKPKQGVQTVTPSGTPATGITAASAGAQPFTQPMTIAGITPTTPSKTPQKPPAGGGGGDQTSKDLAGYKTVKGVLNFNGQAFNGEYNGKYYKDGKLQTDEQVKADFLAKYGEQAKFIQSVPELSNLLTQAIQGNWNKELWVSQFANTTWAQTHPGDIGLAEIQRVSVPDLYNRNYNFQQNRLAMLANQLGVNLTPDQLGAQIPNENLTNVTQVDQKKVDNGQDIVNWMMQNPTATDAQIMQRLAKYGAFNPKNPTGLIGAAVNTLQGIARDYGVSGMFNPQSLADYALNIQQGTPGYDANTFEANAKQLASQLYKPYAKQIQDGIKVSTLAAPYTSILGSLLEISPSGIDLGAPTGYGKMVSSAMIGNNDPNNPVPTDPYDFAAQVRSLPEWLNTQNAHDTVMSGVNQMLKAFNFGGA